MIGELETRARAYGQRIVLPEGDDVRILLAAAALVNRKIAHSIVLGPPKEVRARADGAGVTLPAEVAVVDPHTSPLRVDTAKALLEKRKSKGMTEQEASRLAVHPLYFANLLVALGEADGCVAGAVHATSDVVRAAIHVHGLKKDSVLVSSFFLMGLSDGRVLTYADCGVNPEPNAQELASIGIDAGINHRLLTGEEPRIAFLSFSTKGSAEHAAVSNVQEAVTIARSLQPSFTIDGELQFDAAFVPDVAARKAPDSPLRGKANVFVFPDLTSGNIAYKITERIGGAMALGPILQGLARPSNDLSRGADVDSIVNVVAITALQAGAA